MHGLTGRNDHTNSRRVPRHSTLLAFVQKLRRLNRRPVRSIPTASDLLQTRLLSPYMLHTDVAWHHHACIDLVVHSLRRQRLVVALCFSCASCASLSSRQLWMSFAVVSSLMSPFQVKGPVPFIT